MAQSIVELNGIVERGENSLGSGIVSSRPLDVTHGWIGGNVETVRWPLPKTMITSVIIGLPIIAIRLPEGVEGAMHGARLRGWNGGIGYNTAEGTFTLGGAQAFRYVKVGGSFESGYRDVRYTREYADAQMGRRGQVDWMGRGIKATWAHRGYLALAKVPQAAVYAGRGYSNYSRRRPI